MADWYCSSASYAAIAAFVPSAVYSVGNIVKPTAPALKAKWAFRCTTAGTASTEPAWPTTNNSTVTTGGATFTNVTGQSTFGWSAAAGDLQTLLGGTGPTRFAAGDRIFASSDHSETQTASATYGSGGSGVANYNSGQTLSVNRAGSVPPVAADLAAGATVAVSGNSLMVFESTFPVYHYGINYNYAGTNANGVQINTSSTKGQTFDACVLYMNTATTMKIATATPASIILNNTALRFTTSAQGIGNAAGNSPLFIEWRNTASAILGTLPTILFAPTNTVPITATCRGVDLSALTTTLLQNGSTGNSNCGCKILLDSCQIASGLTRYGTGTVANVMDEVELVNCYDGTNFISERYVPAGVLTTEFTITLSGGATDNVGTFSHKLVSGANVDKYVNTLNSFWMDVNYATTGSAKTATVEIISSASLNNDEVSLVLEYLGASGSSLASFGTSLPATVLTAASAITASTATWNASPATPVKQKLQVTFTPRTAGRVRAQVRLGKASTTVYINPQVAIT